MIRNPYAKKPSIKEVPYASVDGPVFPIIINNNTNNTNETIRTRQLPVTAATTTTTGTTNTTTCVNAISGTTVVAGANNSTAVHSQLNNSSLHSVHRNSAHSSTSYPPQQQQPLPPIRTSNGTTSTASTRVRPEQPTEQCTRQNNTVVMGKDLSCNSYVVPYSNNYVDLTTTTTTIDLTTTTTTINDRHRTNQHQSPHTTSITNSSTGTTAATITATEVITRNPQSTTTTGSTTNTNNIGLQTVRPSSASSCTSLLSVTSSQLSQQQQPLVWNTNTNSNSVNTKKRSSDLFMAPSTSSATRKHDHDTQNNNNNTNNKTTAIDRYHNTVPPEIRFQSTDKVTQPIQDEYRTALVKNASLSEPLLNGWTLYSHQKRAILVSLLMRRHILALDMGLGKTVIGCCYARAFVRTIPNLRVVVICPVSLKAEWQRTAQDMTGLTIHKDSDTNPKPKKKAKGKDVGTDENSTSGSSYDGIVGDGVVTIASWAKVPHPDDILTTNRNHPYIVVADEAHSMQSMASARTRDALHLMLAPNAVGVLLLTGTPMKNGKPSNLFPLLKAVKHPFGNHQRAYEAHFCGGRDMTNGIGGRPMWVATGAANLDQLRVLTKSHMLHMTKDDVLKELPKQTRVKKTVFVSSKSQMRHNDAMRKLSLVYENRQDPFHQDSVLGAVQNMRLIDSFAKVAATVDVAREVLRKEPAIVIFTSFVDVAKMVHEKLSEYGWTGELLTGETPAKKRQGMVDKFQNGLSPVFCCTFGAGGVGLTLTAASTVILLDRPWTPGDVHQAEDRVRRIGQTKPVTSIWMSAFELDQQIDEMIECKSQTSTTVLSEQGCASAAAGASSSSSSTGTAAPKLSILKLVHSFIASQSKGSSDGYKQSTLPDYGHGKFRTY